MRKLKLQMQVTLDGYNSTGPNDEQRWVTWDLDGILPSVLDLLDSSDTILIGRKLADGYIPFWQDTSTKPNDPMYELATRIVNSRKVVFSKTLTQSSWDTAEIATGLLKDEVNALKSQKGKDLIVYGGSSFVASLIQEGLIDEFHFYINPIAIGKGISAFGMLDNWQHLTLINSTTFDSGILLVIYKRK